MSLSPRLRDALFGGGESVELAETTLSHAQANQFVPESSSLGLTVSGAPSHDLHVSKQPSPQTYLSADDQSTESTRLRVLSSPTASPLSTASALPASQTSEMVQLLLQQNDAAGRPRDMYRQPLLPTGSSTATSSSRTLSSKPWSHSPSSKSPSPNGSAVVVGSSFHEKNLFPSHGQGYLDEPEDDDVLHDPKMMRKRLDDTGTVFTVRGCLNIGTLILLAGALLMLFAGYPIMTDLLRRNEGNKGGFGLGGSNATGQIPMMQGMPQLIDKDTPREAYERISFDGSGKRMKLVFSDEFNSDGRSFYPGDDPFWEAANLHYWGTGNYEWYDPAAVTTKDGNLVFTLSEYENHNLNFRGAMISTWNKFCFTGGYIEVRVILPGAHDVSGLWPAAWTMGNLGRAGYGATNDGMWPYTYDECDVGTLPNQTWPASMGGGPVAAETTGRFVESFGPGLSYLPGQRLSRCTCPNYDDHPGPKLPDGSWRGRSAPEIDILEAAAGTRPGQSGHVSMSLQMAPYDPGYNLTTARGAYEFYDDDVAELNSYTGAPYQQAASGIITTRDEAYELNGMEYDTYGFEYKEGGESDAYILWTRSGRPMWRLNALALGPNPGTEVGQRSVPYEPMYIILNLGLSSSFSYVDFSRLTFPAKYYVDYVRVWQPEDQENLGCDPPDAPTQDYINRHWEAYNNPNLTIWDGDRTLGAYGGAIPPNRLVNQC